MINELKLTDGPFENAKIKVQNAVEPEMQNCEIPTLSGWTL